MFGFQNLLVETAGGGSGGGGQAGADSMYGDHMGLLAGIVNAEEVRDLIQARMDKQQTPKKPEPAEGVALDETRLLKGILNEVTELNRRVRPRTSIARLLGL